MFKSLFTLFSNKKIKCSFCLEMKDKSEVRRTIYNDGYICNACLKE
jgi:hypothetical protein